MNPYAPPLSIAEPYERVPLSPEEVRELLRLPAYGMIASGAMGIVVAGGAMLAAALVSPPDPEKALFGPVADHVMTLIAGIFLVMLHGLIIRGGLALLRLESYHLARWGALLAAASLGGACLAGFPFGVWAILRLTDGRVRAVFAAA